MYDSEQTKLFIDISSKLASIDAKMGTLCITMEKHEQRISNLEQSQTKDSDYRWIVQWLLKGLMISLATIASISGAAGIVTKIIGI